MTKIIKIVVPIIIIVVILALLFPIVLKMLPKRIQNLKYRVPLKVSNSQVSSHLSIYGMGVKGSHEDDWYEFDDCKLIVEYFEDDVTNNSKLDLIKANTKTINGHKWYYSSDKYFTNHNGNTYIVRITNSDSCNKINDKVIKTLKFK